MSIKVSQLSMDDFFAVARNGGLPGSGDKRFFFATNFYDITGHMDEYDPKNGDDAHYVRAASEFFERNADDHGHDFVAIVGIRQRESDASYIKDFIAHLDDQGPDGLGAKCPDGRAILVTFEEDEEREVERMTSDLETFRSRGG